VDELDRIVAVVPVSEAQALALKYALDDYLKAGDYDDDEFTFWNLKELVENIEHLRACEGLKSVFSPDSDATKDVTISGSEVPKGIYRQNHLIGRRLKTNDNYRHRFD